MKSWPAIEVVRQSATGFVSNSTEPTRRSTTRMVRTAILIAPLVGAILGVIAAAAMLAARTLYVGPTVYIGVVNVQYFEAPLIAAAIALVLVALLTQGAQLAGLAETADLMGRRHQPGHEVTAERGGSPALGSLGALAMVCCLLLDTLALGSSVLAHHGTQSLLFGVITGKLAMVWGCTGSARPGIDDSDRVPLAGTVPRWAATGWTAVVCAGAATYGRFDSEVGTPRGAARAVIAVLVAITVSWLVRRRVVKRLGGISASSLGALCEIATVVSLLITAAGRP